MTCNGSGAVVVMRVATVQSCRASERLDAVQAMLDQADVRHSRTIKVVPVDQRLLERILPRPVR